MANLVKLEKRNAGGMLGVPRPDWTGLLPATDRCHHSAINAATQGLSGGKGPNKVKGGPAFAARPRRQSLAGSQFLLRSTSARCLIQGIISRSLAPTCSIG